MKLYFASGTCSLAPHIVIRELGLDSGLVPVDIKTKKTKDGGDFLAINAKGSVPVLELDDGQRLTEVPAILQYLADLKPEAGLVAPVGGLPRVRHQEMLNFVTSELHKSYSPLFNPLAPDAWKAVVRDLIGRKIALVEGYLSAQPFLMGAAFTVSDAYAHVVLAWSRHVGIDLSAWPAVAAYMDRVAGRDSVKAALAAEKEARR